MKWDAMSTHSVDVTKTLQTEKKKDVSGLLKLLNLQQVWDKVVLFCFVLLCTLIVHFTALELFGVTSFDIERNDPLGAIRHLFLCCAEETTACQLKLCRETHNEGCRNRKPLLNKGHVESFNELVECANRSVQKAGSVQDLGRGIDSVTEVPSGREQCHLAPVTWTFKSSSVNPRYRICLNTYC